MWKGRNSYSYIVGALWMSIHVMAFLYPATTRVLHTNDHLEAFIRIQLHATKRSRNAEIPDDRGLATFFELRKKKQDFAQPTKSELPEGTGFLKSISRWKEGRKQKGNLDEPDKTQNSGTKSNGWKNVDTQQQKDAKNGAAFERERIRRYQAGIKSAGTSSDSIDAADDESEWALKRFNPVSAAQKLLSAVSNKQKSSKEEWIVVASKTSIAPGALVPISAAGLDLLLVASKDGSALHCIANSCPHLGTPLEIGTLERRPVENPDYEVDNADETPSNVQENYLARLLTQDGCEDCIICPLHKTAFALESGEVRGEWCPYPPVVGKVVGTIKPKSALPVFDVRTKGKNIEVRINTPIRVDGPSLCTVPSVIEKRQKLIWEPNLLQQSIPTVVMEKTETNVPKRYPLDQSLGFWVATQRTRFCMSDANDVSVMEKERIDKLNGIGFVCCL